MRRGTLKPPVAFLEMERHVLEDIDAAGQQRRKQSLEGGDHVMRQMRAVIDDDGGRKFDRDAVQKAGVLLRADPDRHTLSGEARAIRVDFHADDLRFGKIPGPDRERGAAGDADFEEVDRLIAERPEQFLIMAQIVPAPADRGRFVRPGQRAVGVEFAHAASAPAAAAPAASCR